MVEGARKIGELSFDEDGAEYHPKLAVPFTEKLSDVFAAEGFAPGTRLTDLAAFIDVLGPESRIGSLVSDRLDGNAFPVRAIAFDKSPSANWSLGWHQDRTICVKRRADVEGFGPWTTKQGLLHVQPPFSITQNMATVRIHLDPVNGLNAPLKVALGSHLLGRIAEGDASHIAASCQEHVCLANRGDVWLYTTAILHASDRTIGKRRRRVLQIDYSADTLPYPLEWLLR